MGALYRPELAKVILEETGELKIREICRGLFTDMRNHGKHVFSRDVERQALLKKLFSKDSTTKECKFDQVSFEDKEELQSYFIELLLWRFLGSPLDNKWNARMIAQQPNQQSIGSFNWMIVELCNDYLRSVAPSFPSTTAIPKSSVDIGSVVTVDYGVGSGSKRKASLLDYSYPLVECDEINHFHPEVMPDTNPFEIYLLAGTACT